MSWIKCSERLPEGPGTVLIAYIPGSGEKRYPEAAYFNPWQRRFWLIDGELDVTKGVTHWQPLPEPPKDGE